MLGRRERVRLRVETLDSRAHRRCLELFEAHESPRYPPQDITPPPPHNYELRVIIWKAEDLKLDDLEWGTTDIAGTN